MTFTELINKINQFIIANNNREITADVLNPILKDIANFFDNEVGQLDNSNVNGFNIVDKINTLNSLINQVQGLTILNGESNPNLTPPLFYNVGDFYIQSVSGLILGCFVFSGTEWVSLQNWINDSVVSDSLTWSSQKIVNYINNKNELISTNGYLLTDSSIIFYAGARWRINNNIYTNQNDITIPIPIASPGNYRTDLYVGNESGLIVRIAGNENTTIQAAPNLPTNTVSITESTTYGDSTAIQPAPNLDSLKSKLENGIVYFNDSGVIDNFNLVGQESHLYINGATELKSIQITNGWQPYDGKQLILTNNSNNDIVIINNASGQNVYAPFIFANNQNYTLKQKESIVFYYSISNGKFNFLSSNLTIGYVQRYKTINGNVTLDNSYNNCIVLITNTCTITLPISLDITFNAVFLTVGNYVATFTEASGVTLNAVNGKKLGANKNASLVTLSQNNLVLRGELEV